MVNLRKFWSDLFTPAENKYLSEVDFLDRGFRPKSYHPEYQNIMFERGGLGDRLHIDYYLDTGKMEINYKYKKVFVGTIKYEADFDAILKLIQ